MKKYLIAAALLAAPLFSQAQVVIHDENLIMEVPAGWDTIHVNGIAAALSPLGPGDDFRENVNVVTDFSAPDVMLDDYFDMTLNGLATEYKLQRSDIDVQKQQAGKNKISAYRVQYRTLSDVNTSVMLLVTQYILKGKKAFYVITYTTKPDGFNLFWDDTLKMLNSFEPLK